MAGLNKDDLKQMNRRYFQSLSQKRLEVDGQVFDPARSRSASLR